MRSSSSMASAVIRTPFAISFRSCCTIIESSPLT
jgi:hypothetical protein